MDIDFTSFANDVYKDASKFYSDLLKQTKSKIEIAAITIFVAEMKASETYRSILNGDLEGEFGLANPQEALDSITTAISQAARFELVEQGNDIVFELGISASDFADALGADGASYDSETKKGTKPVDWLQWLLFRGSDKILDGYEIMYLSGKRVVGTPSRTGKALMVQRNYSPFSIAGRYNYKQGRQGPSSSWHVPEQFAGRGSDNWLTEVADKAAPKIFKLLEQTFG